MGIGEIIGLVLGSDVLTLIITSIIRRKKRKTEDKELEIKVLQDEIEFLSKRQEILNKELEGAINKALELQKKIMELTSERSDEDEENEKLIEK